MLAWVPFATNNYWALMIFKEMTLYFFFYLGIVTFVKMCIRDRSRGGVSFGSHSCTHRIMTTITLDEVSEELVRSKQVLFDQGVNFVPVYCYPNGNSDASIEDLVKANGYEAAVSVRMGFEGSCPENRYAIRRIGIHNDISDTIPLFSFRLFGDVYKRQELPRII